MNLCQAHKLPALVFGPFGNACLLCAEGLAEQQSKAHVQSQELAVEALKETTALQLAKLVWSNNLVLVALEHGAGNGMYNKGESSGWPFHEAIRMMQTAPHLWAYNEKQTLSDLEHEWVKKTAHLSLKMQRPRCMNKVLIPRESFVTPCPFTAVKNGACLAHQVKDPNFIVRVPVG